MGKSYSYSIVVEQGDTLFINDMEVPLPPEVTASGENPLGWALQQVRTTYASYYAKDQSSELNLSVRDRRPGGLVRRAKFLHPDNGIDLATFLAPRHSRGSGKSTEPPIQSLPEPAPAEGTPAPGPEQDVISSAEQVPLTSDHPSAAEVQETPTETRQSETSFAPVGVTEIKSPTRGHEASHEEKVRKERGWKKLDRDKSTRPQVGSAENKGRSRRQGLLDEAKKQKSVRIIGLVVLIAVVIIGFRVFNGGTEYEALCVDQRTMTRAVTGVACENETDTNHRWWYTDSKEDLPAPGDSIDAPRGTFDKPTGGKDTVNRHIENENLDE